MLASARSQSWQVSRAAGQVEGPAHAKNCRPSRLRERHSPHVVAPDEVSTPVDPEEEDELDDDAGPDDDDEELDDALESSTGRSTFSTHSLA